MKRRITTLDKDIKKPKISKRNKNNRNNRIKKRIIIFSFSIIFIFIAVYNYINFNIYESIKTKTNSDNIEIEYNLNYLILWDKTINYIKSENKPLLIKNNKMSVLYKNEKLSKIYDFSKFSYVYGKVDYDGLKDIKALTIDLKHVDNVDNILNLGIVLEKDFSNVKNLDIYYINDSNKPIFYKKVLVEKENKIFFDLLKNDKGIIEKKYVVLNVPITDIEINSEILEMKNKETVNLNFKIIPESATNKDVKYEYNIDNFDISSDGKITAKMVGDYEVKIITEDNQITKTLLVKVRGTSVNDSNNEIQPTYVKGVLLVNKVYGLSSSYNPGLDKNTSAAFDNMKADAAKEGIYFNIVSGYRSYNTQKATYNNFVSQYGEKEANTFSAKPGHSEHQTGLALDIGSIDDNFGNTKAGIWLAQNANKYGFILRYLKGKEEITGYKYEPWHFRYVGVPLAKEIYDSGLCLEEFLLGK